VIFQDVHFLPDVLLKMPYIGVFPFSDYFIIFGMGTIVYSFILMKLNGWMERRLPIALCALGAFLLSSAILVGGAHFYSSSKKEYTSFIFPECAASAQVSVPISAPVEEEAETMKSYTNDRLRFSVKYPSYLNEIEEGENAVGFHIKDDPGLAGFSVLTKKVLFDTTVGWLNAQPRGSSESEGIKEILWLDGGGSDGLGAMLIAEYDHVDTDNGRPIYGKALSVVRVNEGVLYKIPLTRMDFAANQIPRLGEGGLAIATSLRVW